MRMVVVSVNDYEILEETAYLLRSPANARRLLLSIEELEAEGASRAKLLERPPKVTSGS